MPVVTAAITARPAPLRLGGSFTIPRRTIRAIPAPLRALNEVGIYSVHTIPENEIVLC